MNGATRIQEKECPEYQEEEIKIEVNVVYQERSVCVSEMKEEVEMDSDWGMRQEIENPHFTASKIFVQMRNKLWDIENTTSREILSSTYSTSSTIDV